MSCLAFYRRRLEHPINVHPHVVQQQRGKKTAAAEKRVEPGEHVPQILGTWDYKWPLGSVIRVAFQRPPEVQNISAKTFEAAMELVKTTANRWLDALVGTEYEELLKNLPKLEFLSDDGSIFAPPLGQENSITDQNRSPFKESQRIQYDVLVSLQDLPVTRADPFRAFGEEVENLVLPTCDMGSYARRADYAAPTAYIGRFGKYAEDDVGLLDFLQSKVGQHSVVHIFGHVLGLAHSYQHPTLVGDKKARKKFYVPSSDVIQFFEDKLKVNLTPALVEEYLFDVWPGDLSFSDWLNYTAQEKQDHQTGILDSIMAPPYYAALVRDARKDAGTDQFETALTAPSTKDLQTLRLMYEPGSDTNLDVSK